MDEPAEVPPEHHALFEDPSHLVCPLSSELFREPVIGRSGRKYEREAIVRWLRQGNNGDPITRMPMTEADLTTSYDDKAAAETYRRTTASKVRADLAEHRGELGRSSIAGVAVCAMPVPCAQPLLAPPHAQGRPLNPASSAWPCHASRRAPRPWPTSAAPPGSSLPRTSQCAASARRCSLT